MRSAWLLCVAASLVGCAAAPPTALPSDLFRDELFRSPTTRIDPSSAMAVSEPMHRYFSEKIANGRFFGDRRQRLIDALYDEGELRLDYDSSRTRTAAEAFEARSGNCLSLVMLTAAFAKEMGLTVRYQLVLGDEVWDRDGDVNISIGHVNLALGERPARTSVNYQHIDPLVVDFLPSTRAQQLRSTVVPEQSIVAMYLNNRAVEAFIDAQVDDAYWWAREAVRTDPELMSSYVTLAVIYRSRHRPDLAERVLSRVLERENKNTRAMANRVLALRDLGRFAEADGVEKELRRLDPHPAFSYFEEGMAAFREGRFEAARGFFAKEVGRAPEQHRFHFWLARAHFELKDFDRAAAELAQASKVSPTRKDHDLYASKLAHLKALTQH